MPYLDPSSEEDFPVSSVEMDALSLFVEAYCAAEPKKGAKLLREAGRILELREKKAERVVEFMPAAQAAERERVRRIVRAWFRRRLPVWLDALDRSE